MVCIARPLCSRIIVISAKKKTKLAPDELAHLLRTLARLSCPLLKALLNNYQYDLNLVLSQNAPLSQDMYD